MVPARRPELHPSVVRHGRTDGAGTWLSLLWPFEKKIGAVHDLGMRWVLFCRHISMVFLGLFSCFLAHRHEWFHRKSGQLWATRGVGES